MKTADFSRHHPGFPRTRNDVEKRLQKFHTDDLSGSASDWSCRVENLLQPIRSNNQVRVVSFHQYGISAVVSQTSFRGETSGCVAKCQLFSQAILDSDNCSITCNTHVILAQ